MKANLSRSQLSEIQTARNVNQTKQWYSQKNNSSSRFRDNNNLMEYLTSKTIISKMVLMVKSLSVNLSNNCNNLGIKTTMELWSPK